MTFQDFNLAPQLLSNTEQLGYTTPTPIQKQAIPSAMAGQDVMGLAQTGTGKTAAFSLPMLQHLLTGPRHVVRSLIIAPTRELAQQIHDNIMQLAAKTKLRSVTLYGGVNINTQIKNLKAGVEIIVACPGRLLDHLQQGTVNLKNIEILVLDEADQMFNMGFLPSIRKILARLPKKKQTLLFSATMPPAIRELANEVLHRPVTIEISHTAPKQSVAQTLFPIDKHLKTELLIHILKNTAIDSVLVFTRTKHTAKKVAQKLETANFRATSLQGNLSQNRRQAAMTGFRDGSLQIMVATDIASRGIDVSNISHVINFDIPETVETYVHRIGRTGRADKVGEAFTLITPDDASEVRAIERMMGKKLEQYRYADFNYAAAAPSQGKLGDFAKFKHTQTRRPTNKKSFKKKDQNQIIKRRGD